MILRIENWHPVSVNKLMSMHWAERRKAKATDLQMIAIYGIQQGVTKATGKRRVEVLITLAKGQRALDQDNYQKSLLDSLVGAGFLKDDNRQWLDMRPIEFDRASRRAITITLTDVA